MIVTPEVHLPGTPPMMPDQHYDVDGNDATIRQWLAGGLLVKVGGKAKTATEVDAPETA